MDGMEGHTFTLSAGIAFAPQDGDTFMELYQKADLALYQVKRFPEGTDTGSINNRIKRRQKYPAGKTGNLLSFLHKSEG